MPGPLRQLCRKCAARAVSTRGRALPLARRLSTIPGRCQEHPPRPLPASPANVRLRTRIRWSRRSLGREVHGTEKRIVGRRGPGRVAVPRCRLRLRNDAHPARAAPGQPATMASVSEPQHEGGPMRILYVSMLWFGFRGLILGGEREPRGMPGFIRPLKRLLELGYRVDMVLGAPPVRGGLNVRSGWAAPVAVRAVPV